MAIVQTSLRATTLKDGFSERAEVTLSWDETDPVAISVRIDQSALGVPVVTWMIGRDLISAALSDTGRFGVGDVAVHAGRCFTMGVYPRRPNGALVVMHRKLVEWLIDEAESMVPSGGTDESDIITAELELVLAELGDAT